MGPAVTDETEGSAAGDPDRTGRPPSGPAATLPRWAAVAVPEASEPDPETGTDGDERPRPAPVRRLVAGVRPMIGALLLSGLALGAAAATRLLPDWDEGRWWVATIVLSALAVVAAVVGVSLAVGAIGEVTRHRRVVKGVVPAVVGLLVGSVLLVGGAALGARDWQTLDGPEAWDRLEIGGDGDNRIEGARRAIDGEGAADAQDLRRGGRVGACYRGDETEPGRSVDCDVPHRLQILGQAGVDDPEDLAYPGVEGVFELVRDDCEVILRSRTGTVSPPEGHRLTAIVPDETAWRAGDLSALCVVTSSKPTEGRVGG